MEIEEYEHEYFFVKLFSVRICLHHVLSFFKYRIMTLNANLKVVENKVRYFMYFISYFNI